MVSAGGFPDGHGARPRPRVARGYLHSVVRARVFRHPARRRDDGSRGGRGLAAHRFREPARELPARAPRLLFPRARLSGTARRSHSVARQHTRSLPMSFATQRVDALRERLLARELAEARVLLGREGPAALLDAVAAILGECRAARARFDQLLLEIDGAEKAARVALVEK